jgi:hypothetical protein
MEPGKISEIIPKISAEKKLQNKKTEEETQFPVAKKESPKIPTPMQAMELSLIFNTSPEERNQGWCKRYLKNDYYIEARALIPDPESEPDLVRGEDLSTLLCCFLLLKHSKAGPSKYTFETSVYQMLLQLGDQPTGEERYKRIRNSLSRLARNSIFTNFWWDTINGERIIKNEFHFLGSVAEGEQKSLRISLSPEIVESLERGYMKLLEESSLLDIIKLRGHAKVLALFLLKLLGSKPQQDLKLKTVLRYLGVENRWSKLPPFRFNDNIKRTIVPAMEKAAKAIGLSCAYNKDKQQFHLRRIGKLKQIESREGELPRGPEAKRIGQGSHDPLLTQRKNEAFKNLIDIGIASEMIIKLFDESDIEEIERQIEWLPYRKSDNPAGILVSAIRGRWIIPVGYEQKREESLMSRA